MSALQHLDRLGCTSDARTVELAHRCRQYDHDISHQPGLCSQGRGGNPSVVPKSRGSMQGSRVDGKATASSGCLLVRAQCQKRKQLRGGLTCAGLRDVAGFPWDSLRGTVHTVCAVSRWLPEVDRRPKAADRSWCVVRERLSARSRNVWPVRRQGFVGVRSLDSVPVSNHGVRAALLDIAVCQ